MGKKYDFDQIIDRKNTKSLKYDFALKKGMPEDILPLWVADMDFPAADEILSAMRKQLEHGIFGYAEPDDGYFDAVANWMKKRHEFEVQRSWLVKTPGIVFALAMAVQAYTQKGDGILIQTPVYYPFRSVIEDNERVVVENPLVPDEDGIFQMDFEDLERQLQQKSVKFMIFCSPHNPVSRVWTRKEQQRLIDLCIKYEVIIFSDEIHQDFVFGENRHNVLLNVDPAIANQVIIATAPSKTFNLAGLQISNLFIPNKDLRNRLKARMDASGYSQLNIFGLVSCEAAYRYGEDWLEQLKTYLEGNVEYIRHFLAQEMPNVRLIEPQGTYLLWLDFKGLALSEEQINKKIMKKAKVWLDHGTMFGKEGNGYQRINIACPRAILEKAMVQIRDALQ
ncbi:MAG: MalY/PatB family protein [Lachnospiraceae bacterium]